MWNSVERLSQSFLASVERLSQSFIRAIGTIALLSLYTGNVDCAAGRAFFGGVREAATRICCSQRERIALSRTLPTPNKFCDGFIRRFRNNPSIRKRVLMELPPEDPIESTETVHEAPSASLKIAARSESVV